MYSANVNEKSPAKKIGIIYNKLKPVQSILDQYATSRAMGMKNILYHLLWERDSKNAV